ncbi:hypothetical protein PCL_11259 [Purpureocillium lilacinum]|uniref:Uncharacterized protein n=1 Tax=Purpureocillium lilacinum TaxID=33203 RepID=A0A2U3DQ16_PURLI|nr:hypothetical protein PCL_11259 [Purpureocillium lilacinum]
MSPPSLSLLKLVACAARHRHGRPWDQKTDPLEQVDRIVVAAELRYNMGLSSGPLLEASLEKRLARLNNFRGSPAHMDTLVFDEAGESVALNRLCEFLPLLNLYGCNPASAFNNETHSDEVIPTAVFVVASVCSKSNIGFPTLSDCGSSLATESATDSTHAAARPVTSKKPLFHGQPAYRTPGPPQITRPFHHKSGNILTAFNEATGRSGRLQKQAPPLAPSRPGSASSSQPGPTVQSSPKYTPSPGASAAASKRLGQDKANETPMLAPGAVKPPLSSLAHELTVRLEQASGVPNSSPVKSGFPPANPGVSDPPVASPVATDPMSPSSVASHDSRPVNTPRSGHTENDWGHVGRDKN